jgi:hypothetical protein
MTWLYRSLQKLMAGSLILAFMSLPIETFGQAPQSSSPKASAKELKLALLIGINEYKDLDIDDLRGPENDVRLIESLLTEAHGFDRATDINELISSKTGSTAVLPTRKNIEQAFRDHLIAKAKTFKDENPQSDGATVVFFYSGHGSYVDDQLTVAEGKDEPDGRDVTIVPMDGLKWDGSKDIRDDDINRWFRELRQYTSNITFIFDSCHSGTVTRGNGKRNVVRNTSRNSSPTRGAPSLNETMDTSDSYVTISGSLPNEESQEEELPPLQLDAGKATGRPESSLRVYGLLTYYLVQTALQNIGLTYRELMQLVSTAVNRANPLQTPQIEGDVDRTFLGTKASRNKRPIPLSDVKIEKAAEGERILENSILTIGAGRVVGALPGGSVGIFPSKSNRLADDTDRIATGKIVESGNYVSKVLVRGLAVPRDAKIVLINPFFTDEKRKVFLDTTGTGPGPAMIGRLRQILKNNDYVSPLESANASRLAKSEWTVAVSRATYAEFRSGRDREAEKGQGPLDNDIVYFLADKNGNPLYNFFVLAGQLNAEALIAEALERHVRIENLLALNNPALSGAGKGLKIELVRLKSWREIDEGGPCQIEEFTNVEQKMFKNESHQVFLEDYGYFEITNNTDNDLYVYVYNVSSEGEIQVLSFPEADGDILKRNRTMVTLTTDRCSGLFRAKPIGKESYKLIATTQRFDEALLTQPKIAKDIVSRSDSPVDALLIQASTNKRSDRVNVPFSGWATARFDLEIVEKPSN